MLKRMFHVTKKKNWQKSNVNTLSTFALHYILNSLIFSLRKLVVLPSTSIHPDFKLGQQSSIKYASHNF